MIEEGLEEHEVRTESATVTGHETILVVEDQGNVREYAARALKAYGYRVISTASAVEALTICERGDPRIEMVLSDVVMPQMSGPDLVDRLRTMQPEIKALFMSGYTENVVIHHGMRGESEQFIQKPFAPEDLARKARELLGRPSGG